MKLKDKLLYFDIYSKTASFYYNNQEKIGSKFGLFLTILHVIAALIIIIYYLIIAFQRSELKEYQSSTYAKDMPMINIDSNNLFFAFGLEDPATSNRYIDETIYYPQILFIDRFKINGEFQINEKELEYDRCKEEDFGLNYQHFLNKGELNNSYCLKNFDYNLTLTGGYKYEKMTYISIKIFPCKNDTNNNYHCKPPKVINSYLTSGYFSIMIKDLGLNPSNYSNPVIPTLQKLFTTIDRRLYKNFFIKFGITEIDTDIGFFNENIHKEKYLKYRESSDYFFFREEQEINDGNDEICTIQLALDETITVQTRKYTKIADIFPQLGGYMNLIYILFSFFSILINQFNLELKIINAIFNFNLKENKMVFKLSSFNLNSLKVTNLNKSVIMTSHKNLENFKFDFNKIRNKNKNKNNEKNDNNNSCASNNLDNSDSKKMTAKQNNNNNKIRTLNNNMKINTKKHIIRKSQENYPKFNLFINDKEDRKDILDFKDNISINLFDYICRRKNHKIKQSIELYNLGIGFYRKIMDIIHVFVLLLITEKVLFKNNKQQIYYYLKDNNFLFNKNTKNK